MDKNIAISVKNVSMHFNMPKEKVDSIKEFLVSHGMYAPLVRSYLNFTVDRAEKLFNLLPNEHKDDFWNILHNEYLEALAWAGRDAADFDRPELYDFVTCLEHYTYDEYKKAIKHRDQPFDDAVKLSAEYARRRSRIRGFFSRVFGKKR